MEKQRKQLHGKTLATALATKATEETAVYGHVQ